MAAQNEALRIVAERTRLDANEANEELIGRIGLDIHDGPIQQLSLLMLRIGALRPPEGKGNEKAAKIWSAIRDLGTSAIQELRVLSTGLALPEIGDLSAAEAIELAAERHENLTGTRVEVNLGPLPANLPAAFKICLYRIVQESLSNSFRHAGGEGQRVSAAVAGGRISVRISDTGGGMAADAVAGGVGTKLGLRGIRNRAQAFGGVAEIRSDDIGTTVDVRLPVDGAVRRDAVRGAV